MKPGAESGHGRAASHAAPTASTMSSANRGPVDLHAERHPVGRETRRHREGGVPGDVRRLGVVGGRGRSDVVAARAASVGVEAFDAHRRTHQHGVGAEQVVERSCLLEPTATSRQVPVGSDRGRELQRASQVRGQRICVLDHRVASDPGELLDRHGREPVLVDLVRERRGESLDRQARRRLEAGDRVVEQR